MNVVWHYAAGGAVSAPLAWEELRAAARSGAFGPDDWVWTPGWGSGWRKASTLEGLFPPPPPPDRAAKSAAGEPAPVVVLPAERSPFEPVPPDGRPPRPVRVGESLATALANLRVLLFRPFSWRRWLVFALSAFLLVVGGTTDAAARLLATEGSPSQHARLERLGLSDVAASPLFTLPARWGDPRAAMGRREELLRDLADSLQDASVRLRAWALSPGRTALPILIVAVLLAFRALSSWFLARGWTTLLGRVYRRDEPSAFTWASARVPATAVFRGTFAVRGAFLLVEAAAVAWGVAVLAARPAGAVGPSDVAAAVLGFAALELLEEAATGVVRDFAVPRVVLQRLPFGAALRAAVRDAARAGLYPRYLAALVPLGAAANVAAAAASGAVFAFLGSPEFLLPFLPLLFACFAAPWQLLRCLWTLDFLFRREPGLRSALPPRALPVAVFRFPGRGGGPEDGAE